MSCLNQQSYPNRYVNVFDRSTRSPLPSPRLSPSQSQSGPRHASTSSDIDLQGSQCLTLTEPLPPPPPQGRNRVASASLAYPQSSLSQLTGHDDLYAVSNDVELQRALEISRLSLQGKVPSFILLFYRSYLIEYHFKYFHECQILYSTYQTVMIHHIKCHRQIKECANEKFFTSLQL